jgi:hypothetical protein
MVSQSGRTRGGVLALVLSFGLLGGCNSIAQDIEVSEDDLFMPALRASYDLEESADTEDAPGARWRKILTIDAEVAHTSGADSQELSPGELISFDGTDFIGPFTVASDFDLTVASLTARIGGNYRERFSIAGLIGLGYSNLDLELSAPGLIARDASSGIGVSLGMQMDWHTLSWLDLSFRLGGLYTGDISLMMNDLSLRAWPIEQVGVFVGWRAYIYEEDRTGGSDVELDLAGPTAGIEFSF